MYYPIKLQHMKRVHTDFSFYAYYKRIMSLNIKL